MAGIDSPGIFYTLDVEEMRAVPNRRSCGERASYIIDFDTAAGGKASGGMVDGFGTVLTAVHWKINDSIFRWNTSDGLDFLYVREPGPG